MAFETMLRKKGRANIMIEDSSESMILLFVMRSRHLFMKRLNHGNRVFIRRLVTNSDNWQPSWKIMNCSTSTVGSQNLLLITLKNIRLYLKANVQKLRFLLDKIHKNNKPYGIQQIAKKIQLLY